MTPNISIFSRFFRQLSSKNLYFTKNHEWLKLIQDESSACNINNNFRARVGITDYSQKALGDIIFVDLPKINCKYHKEGN